MMIKKCAHWSFSLCLFTILLFFYSIVDPSLSDWSVLPPGWVLLVFAALSVVMGGIGFQNTNWMAVSRSLFTIFASFFLTAALTFTLLLPNQMLGVSESPNGSHEVSVYLRNGGAATSYFVVGKLEGPLWFSKTIYSEKGTDKANVTWEDDHTLSINGETIQIDY
ncbi:DUF5412 family protein [Salibacterium aidingense]|uniref:DUF5412 family protein n=1 Tax=Salibacterium aidingense TaxID=384933 RepID=UPI003BBBB6BA